MKLFLQSWASPLAAGAGAPGQIRPGQEKHRLDQSVAGLIAGFWIPGVGLAAMAGLVVYFLTAAGAHLRAGYTGRDFWLNCLGMLALTVLVLIWCFLV